MFRFPCDGALSVCPWSVPCCGLRRCGVLWVAAFVCLFVSRYSSRKYACRLSLVAVSFVASVCLLDGWLDERLDEW